MEPMNIFKAAMVQPAPQPKSANSAQETGRNSGRHGLPQRALGLSQEKSSPEKYGFSRHGNTEVVQKDNCEDEHKSVSGELGQQRM
jgi:hypothetical protein